MGSQSQRAKDNFYVLFTFWRVPTSLPWQRGTLAGVRYWHHNTNIDLVTSSHLKTIAIFQITVSGY